MDPTQPTAVICETGNRSQSAAALLGQKGFTKVYNVLDGTTGWQRAKLRLAAERVPNRPLAGESTLA